MRSSVRSAAALVALFLPPSICALVNLRNRAKYKCRMEERFRSDISARAEVNKKDEDGTRCYQSAGEAHRTTTVEDWNWKARDGDVWRFRGWRPAARCDVAQWQFVGSGRGGYV
jgi:hypothetical protein